MLYVRDILEVYGTIGFRNREITLGVVEQSLPTQSKVTTLPVASTNIGHYRD